MKILITGATGLVGKNLIKKLLHKSYKINFLTTQKNKEKSIEGCTGFYWNPYKGIIDLKAFHGVTHVINLAGESISKPWTRKYKIKLIEDCAHGLGSKYKNKHVGNFGMTGCFSFYPTKVLTTGEGGMITTNNKSLYKKFIIFREHGKKNPNENIHTELGYNWRLSEISGLLGVQQVKKAKNILNTKAPATPQAIIFFLFCGAKFAAIRPIMIALSAAITISISMICIVITNCSTILLISYII